MWRTISIALFCWLPFVAQSYAQDVFVPRELKAVAVKPVIAREQPPEVKAKKPLSSDAAAKNDGPAGKTAVVKEQPARTKTAQTLGLKAEPSTESDEKTPSVKEHSPNASNAKIAAAKSAPSTSVTAKTGPPKEQSASAPAKSQIAKTEAATPSASKTSPVKEQSAKSAPEKSQVAKVELVTAPATKSSTPVKEQAAISPPVKKQTVKIDPATVPPARPAPVKEQSTAKSQPVKTEPATASTKAAPIRDQPVTPATTKNAVAAKTETVPAPLAKTAAPKELQPAPAAKNPVVRTEPIKAITAKTPQARETAVAPATKSEVAKTEPVKVTTIKEPMPNRSPLSVPAKSEPAKVQPPQEPTVNVQLTNGPMEMAFTKLADGFDFPVGKPEAEGYYKARGFRSGGHMGEDWDGVRGGDTDFNDPIYCVGDGIVVFARDVHLGWGNVVIVRHAYRENGMVKHIDSLYGHLNKMLVSRGQRVMRGQQIATMGTAHGQYDAHLHLEIRKNLEIGMSRSKFQKNFSNYYDPSQFIASHRHLSGGGANFKVAMNTFAHDSAYHFDSAPNFSARKRSNAESAAALKRAISSTTR
jgi:murein DD-endopeptidase MepM/ murein hydrolase activator NlpD